MQGVRGLTLGLMALSMTAACIPNSNAVDWRDCPGSTGLFAPGPELARCLAQAGPVATDAIRVGLGDNVADLVANSSFAIETDATGLFFTDEPVDLVWREGGKEFLFDDVGGTGQSVLLINFSDTSVHSLSFAWQNRPLTLRETVERAQRLQLWLAANGYVAREESERSLGAFEVLDDYQVSTGRVFDDWSSAEAALASESDNIQEIRLFALAAGDTSVIVSAKNMRRAAINFQDRGAGEPLAGVRRTIFDGNGGYEWLLEVSIRPADGFAAQ